MKLGNSYTLFRRIEIKVADMTDSPACNSKSSMHEMMILTDKHIVVGSYNLSTCSRCKNWESIRVVQPVEKDKEEFVKHGKTNLRKRRPLKSSILGPPSCQQIEEGAILLLFRRLWKSSS